MLSVFLFIFVSIFLSTEYWLTTGFNIVCYSRCHFFRCWKVILYTEYFFSCSICVRTINTKICYYSWIYLAILFVSIYVCNRQYSVCFFLDWTVSTWIVWPMYWTVCWLFRIIFFIVFQICCIRCFTESVLSDNSILTNIRKILKLSGIVKFCKYYIQRIICSYRLVL